MTMANVNFEVLDSENLVFAIDIVKYLLLKHYRSTLSHKFVTEDIVRTVEGRRALSRVKEHFSERHVSILVDEIDGTVTDNVVRDFSQMKDKAISSLEEYIHELKKTVLTKGFSAKDFLTFCIRTCLMSCLFRENGTEEAVVFAVKQIETSFPDNEDECKLLWKEMSCASKECKKNSLGNTSATARRETTGDISTETDESSDSSTTNTGSNSASESQNTTSASSAESLHELIMRLNASTMENANNVQLRAGPSSGASATSESVTDHERSADASSTENNLIIEGVKNAISAIFASTANENEAQSEEIATSPNTNYDDSAENKENATAVSSTNLAECVASGSKDSSDSLQTIVQISSASSSTSKMPTCEFNFEEKFDFYFKEGEKKSPLTTPVKSPTTSLLGKRPSPRATISLRSVVDDSETAIKKLKLDSSEEKDE